MKGGKGEDKRFIERENPINDKFYELIKAQWNNISARALNP